MQAKLIGIAFKAFKRAPMQQRNRVFVSKESGIQGDHRGQAENRQLTVITKDCWDATLKELEQNLHWTSRRANLFVNGINLKESAGMYLVINNMCLEITGETKPCERMDEVFQGLQQALLPDWRGGVTCRVIREGKIAIGDLVYLRKTLE